MVKIDAGPDDRLRSAVCPSLQATAYERVSAALTSVLLLLGTLTLLMLLVWLTGTARWTRPPARVSFGGGGPAEKPNAPPDQAIPDFQPPGQEELAEASQPSPEPTLEMIAPIVESQRVSIDALEIGDGDSRKTTSNKGKKEGNDRPGGGPVVGTMPWDRWEVRFSSSDLDEYKRQLDFFGIEFGIAGGGITTVDYVKGFAANQPTVRLAQDPKLERRVRFLYRDGPLKEADRGLARAAGINLEGRVIFHFYSQELYTTLLKLENEKMRPRHISDVARTIFGIKKVDSGYAFYVIRQDYRHPVVPPIRTMTRNL